MVLFCKYGFVIVVIVKNSHSFGILRADLLKKTKKYIKIFLPYPGFEPSLPMTKSKR